MLKYLFSQKTQLLIIIVLTLLAYANILRNEFVIDDKTFILDWQTKNSFSNLGLLLKGNLPSGHEGVWRPLRSVLYAFDWKIFGASPFGYHLQSIFIHLGATVLIYFITFELTKKRMVAFLAGIFFGLHPIHTETISYIASSMETLGVVLALGSFYLFLRAFAKKKDFKNFYAISVVLAFAGYLTTEITLTLPILIVLYEVCFRKLTKKNFGGKVLFYFPYVAGVIVYLLVRFLVISAGARGPYLANSVYLTFLTMTKVVFSYLSLTIFPLGQANNHIISKGIEAFVYRDYRTEAISAQSVLDPQILLSIAFIGAIVGGAVYAFKKLPIVTFGVIWFLAALLPVLDIVPQGSVFNEKFLYLPSYGLILILAYYLNVLLENKYSTAVIGIVLSIAGTYLVLTISRNRDWHDNISLWTKDIKVNGQDNSYAYFQLGNAYAEKGIGDLAVANYGKSFEINPRFVVALGSIGKVYSDMGRVDLAINFYKKSLEVNPSFWEAHNNLANIYFKRADFDLATKEYQQILAILPGFTQIEENLKNLPSVKEATQAGRAGDSNVWLRYHRILGLSLAIPSNWRLVTSYGSMVISDDRNELTANFTLDRKDLKQSQEEYLAKQQENLGELLNQGPALIPNFDRAYVKVWSFDSAQDQEGTGEQGDMGDRVGQAATKLQFFLFNEDSVVKILVSPADSPQMRVFDVILGSIKAE